MTYIKKAEITDFGKFHGFETEFESGFCELTFENEFGKSTLTDFILFILYGFVSTRARKIDLSEQFLRKYMPWDGGDAISGTLTVVCDERELYIRRHQRESGRQTVSITDISGSKIDFEGTPGEYLFGVDRDTFLRTFLIRQTDIKFYDTDGLRKALTNLVTTGDEDTSFDTALDTLYKKRTKYRHRDKKTGRIFDIPKEITFLEGECISLKREAEQLESRTAEREQLIKQTEQLSLKEKELRELLPRAQAQEAKILVSKLDETDEKIKELRTRLDSTSNVDGELLERAATLYTARDRLEESVDSARAELSEYTEKLRTLEAESKKPRMPFVIGGAAVILLGAGILFLSIPIGVILCIAGIVPAVLGFITGGNRSELSAVQTLLQKTEQRLEMLESELESTREKCEYLSRILGTDNIAGITALHGCLNSANSLKGMLENLLNEREALLKGSNEDEARELATAEGCEYRVSDIESMLSETASQRARATERAAALYESSALKTELDKKLYDNGIRIDELKQELELATYRNAVLEKAIEALTAANGQINSRFAPRLCELAGEILKQITDGRYENIYLDTKFNIRIKADGAVRDLGYFSRGTMDAVYFAMRFASARLLAEGRNLPVIMDDPFWSLDGKRLAAAKSYVRKISENTQVILFSAR